MQNNKIKLLAVSIASCTALAATIAVASKNSFNHNLSTSATSSKSFVFNSSVGQTYFQTNRDREKTISNVGSSDIHAGVSIKGQYSSDIRFGGSGCFLEKQEYAMKNDFNFIVGANNITSFSLRFRMANWQSTMSSYTISYNSYVYFYDENYNISTALSKLSAQEEYGDPLYASDNLGSSGIEKGTYYTVSWSKPANASYIARHMRLYFTLTYQYADKNDYANVQFESLTVNWEC